MNQAARRFKWIWVAGFIFVVSLFYATPEIKYLLWGKTADAHVLNLIRKIDFTNKDKSMLTVEYEFSETDGKARQESDSVSLDWPIGTGDKITVEYLPKEPRASRLAGHSAIYFIYLSLGCFIFLAFGFYQRSRALNSPLAK